ncbi:MAG: energy-coupling factor transporter ATPase [Oscillospiraceae bacterium]
MIKAENVHFSYGDKEILKGVSLDIKEGEFISILGHNGSGKSTFAKLINGILTTEVGKITVDGLDVSNEDNLFDVRKLVGMVFQNPDNQIVSAIVEEDVAFAPENLGVEPTEIRKRVDESLKAVNMYDYRLHAPSQLSGGQKQRVAIAGIIAMRPKYIVLDEPTAMLDPSGRAEVLQTIKKLKEDFGITIILITHYMEEAVQSDRVVVIDDGKILLDGTPKDVFSYYDILKKVGLDVPQVTEVAYQLNSLGIDIKSNVLTEDELINELVKLL